MFNGINWGATGDLEHTNGTVRVYTWMFSELDYHPGLLRSVYDGTTNPNQETMTFDPSNETLIMMVQVKHTGHVQRIQSIYCVCNKNKRPLTSYMYKILL